MVGSPPECGAQIGQLDGEPFVSLELARTVPQGEDVGFTRGEVAGVGGARLGGLPRGASCSSANWRIVSSIKTGFAFR